MSAGSQPTPHPPEPALELHSPDKTLPDLLPARMVNEFVYCPRLFYYEWVEKIFVASADTHEGLARHRRVEAPADALPVPAEAEADKIHSRSIELSSPRLGLVAKLDLIESAAGDAAVTPVDYKKGRPRETDAGPEPWPADRAQIAAQVLLLRDNGYACEAGVLYYVTTKQRVRIVVDAALEAELLGIVAQARAAALSEQIPPPLVESPKCPRCSLVGVCLPDETNALRARLLHFEAAVPPAAHQLPLFAGDGGARPGNAQVRPLIVPRDEQKAVYLNTQGWRVGKSGEVFQVKGPGEGRGRARADELKLEFRLGEISQINLLGNVQISTQALQTLCEAEVPVCYYSQGGYFYGITTGLNTRNVFLRRTQFLSAENAALSLALARRLVAGKIRNQRVMLQRNHLEPPDDALRLLRALAESAENAAGVETLLGIEGAAARCYFGHFAGMLKTGEETDGAPGAADSPEVSGTAASSAPGFNFDFQGRNRRPPRDPVNALLSLAYSLLAKDATVACFALGFDPYWGFYHQPRFGRPSLALDLMEPFRPLIADSAVLSAINTGMVRARDFVRAGPGVALRPEGRRAFYLAYERRMDGFVTHPLFDYRCSYRRMLEIQARLLARFLTGEIPEYPAFVTR